MLKRVVLTAVFASSTFVAVPDAMARNGDEACLLRAGCFFDETNGVWVCADPRAYMLCDESVDGDPA